MRPRGSCTPGRGSRRSSLQRRASEGKKRRGEKRFLRQIHLGNSRSPDPARRCFGEWPPLLVWRKSAAETEMLRAVQGGGGGMRGGGCAAHWITAALQPLLPRRARRGAMCVRASIASPAMMLHTPLGFKESCGKNIFHVI